MRFIELGTDATSVLIGILLDNPAKFQEVSVTAEMLFGHDLKDAFKSIVSLNSRGIQAGANNVYDDMVIQGLTPNFGWLCETERKASNSSYMGSIQAVESDIRRAHSCKVAYDVIELLKDAAGRADVDAIQNCAEPLMNIHTERMNYDFSFDEMFDATLSDAVDALDGKDDKKVSTGLSDIDAILGGFHNGDLIILAARPAMGKTALMINMALGAGKKHRVGIMSGEQPKVQVGYRMFSAESGVNAGRLRTGMSDDEYSLISQAAIKLRDKGGRIYEKPAPTITDVVSKAREWKHKYDISVIYIDYIQRIKAVNRNAPKHEQIGEIAITLKELARELDIPVVALAQVNRSVETRTGLQGARPGTGDIKDSGTIEQEADQILTLYRDEVYNQDTDQRGIAEIDIKKNRHGNTGCVRVEWLAACMKFKNIN